MERIFEVMYNKASIFEMAGSAESINVPVDPSIDVTVLTADDQDPMFVNLEVIRTGISRTNRRRYSPQIVYQINEMVKGLQGYLGHPDPSKTSFEFREPQCIFVGSKMQELDDGTVRSIAKAYIFKSSPLREWIPKSIAAGNPLTVSINAVGDVSRDMINDVIDVVSIKQLDSIDWANPGTEGMYTSKAMSVVSEMKDINNNGGGNDMERNDVIKSITIAELKAYNNATVSDIVKGITLAELQSSNPTLVDQIVNSGKITEMQLKVDGAEKLVKISEVQNVIDAKDAKIAELQDSITLQKITEYKNTKLVELVPEDIREQIGKRIVGKTETEIDNSIANELAYVQELAAANKVSNQARGNTKRVATDEAMKEKFKAMFAKK